MNDTKSARRKREIMVLPGVDGQALLESCAILVRWGTPFRCVFFGLKDQMQTDLTKRGDELGLHGMLRFREFDARKKYNRRKAKAAVVLDQDLVVESIETLAIHLNLMLETSC